MAVKKVRLVIRKCSFVIIEPIDEILQAIYGGVVSGYIRKECDLCFLTHALTHHGVKLFLLALLYFYGLVALRFALW